MYDEKLGTKWLIRVDGLERIIIDGRVRKEAESGRCCVLSHDQKEGVVQVEGWRRQIVKSPWEG